MRKLLICCVTAIVIIISGLAGCKPDPSYDVSANTMDTIGFAIPQGWPQPYYTFQNNTLTQPGFELGRKIFYDPRLSRDNTISCASCHQQFAAFCHLDHSLSHGIDGLFGTRNAPGLFNLAWHPAYFWDGGVNNLENQPINPIQNHVEMDENLPDIINKMGADATYKSMFKSAFGDETINSQRIFKALAQFMAAMVSNHSRYDKYIAGDVSAAFTQQEIHGLSLFREKCATCHKEPLLSDFSYRNNGLFVDPGLNDSGRARITGDPNDMHKFKVPSLRNVDLTRPYMHDGRFQTLDAAVEHYRTDITPSATLDTLLTNGIQMTDNDKADIISFLKTLTDTTFTKDKRFSQP